MPIIKILPNGGSAYMQAPTSETVPIRSDCVGWTRAVSRRNTDFLLSVLADQLTGHGYALTLTVRDCPKTAADWHKIRRRFVERLRRSGLIRLHWLTEWQRRQVPHLHAALWLDQPAQELDIIRHWLASAAECSPAAIAQHVGPITGPAGWFEYLAKHAARGVFHYQRSPDLIPLGWQGKTGRMWGKIGDWPTDEPKPVDVTPAVFHQFRRLAIRYQIGKARRQWDHRRALYFRRYRAQAPKDTSAAQALPRLWIPEADQWRLLALAHKLADPAGGRSSGAKLRVVS